MYEPKNFDHLLGTPGFSDTLLKNHFTLYQGYVTNVNKLSDLMKSSEAGSPHFAELRRRFGWEWNGMRLHELYFGNMAKGGSVLGEGELKKVLEYVWGSVDAWAKDFKATGAMRGIGWAILAFDPEKKMVFNTWVNEHDAGHLAGTAPLLVLDVFEHAYVTDYGIKRPDYLDAFFAAIDWGEVERRFGY